MDRGLLHDMYLFLQSIFFLTFYGFHCGILLINFQIYKVKILNLYKGIKSIFQELFGRFFRVTKIISQTH